MASITLDLCDNANKLFSCRKVVNVAVHILLLKFFCLYAHLISLHLFNQYGCMLWWKISIGDIYLSAVAKRAIFI